MIVSKFLELYSRYKGTPEFIEMVVRGGMKGFAFWDGNNLPSKHRKVGVKCYRFVCQYCMELEDNLEIKELANNLAFTTTKGNLKQGKYTSPTCGCNKFKNKILSKFGIDCNEGLVYETVNSKITVGKGVGKGNSRKYLIHCTLCSEDSELFPELYSTKSNMDRGRYPCNCGKGSPKWTETQYLVKIKRVAKEKGIKFKGFVGEYNKYPTNLKLQCKVHGSWVTTSLDHFLNDNKGCKLCNGGGGYKEYKEGCFYIKIMGRTNCKFGITNRSSEDRSKEHKSIYKEDIILDLRFEDGTIPPQIEKLIKNTVTTKVLTKCEIKSGYTETFSIADLPEVMLLLRPYLGLSKKGV